MIGVWRVFSCRDLDLIWNYDFMEFKSFCFLTEDFFVCAVLGSVNLNFQFQIHSYAKQPNSAATIGF